MLTKEQIEAIEIGGRDDEWEMSGDLSMDDARELRRLALLGLEVETAHLSPEPEHETALDVFEATRACPSARS
jgi:hypothetical protein